MRMRLPSLAGVLVLGASATLHAAATAELTPEQTAFFESKVRPILSSACYKCHSVEQGKSKGKLTLDTREGTLKGGENGAVITPGKPDDSPLITAVKYLDKDLQMPPKGEKLKPDQIAALVEWVKMGAPDPRKSDAKLVAKLSGLTDAARHHWAYQPVKKPAVPEVKNPQWCRTPVDAFILWKLDEKSMMPGVDAGFRVDPVTGKSGYDELYQRGVVLRRASYDLIGLPPTTEELADFQKDPAPFPTAFSKVVERLLASPHYGERWGRFWLDTARYSDTTGGEGNEQKADYRYAYAWTYRDYVVRAINKDKPYDQFIIEQLAADQLPDLDRDRSRLAALGFLTVGQRFNNNNDVINDRIDVVTKGFLAMTVVCARCHDHKFDPIPTKDYYALHGIFSSIEEPREAPVINSPDPKLLKDYETKLAALEEENRRQYYEFAEQRDGDFRVKAGAYLEASALGERGATAEELLKREAFIKENKLNPILTNFLRQRSRGNDAVFGPWRKFEQLAEADFPRLAGPLAREINENRGGKYNPLIAEAFSSQEPKSLHDVAGIYTAAFSKLQPKARSVIDAYSKALTASLPAGFDTATAALVGEPIQMEPAANLTSDRLRDLLNSLPANLLNRNQGTFGKINALKLTHEGAPARAMTVKDKAHPQDSQVFIRGQSEDRGDTVPRRFLEVLSGPKPQPFKLGSGRLELAKAIASKNNPLTARVIVNRVWMHHFGEGLVRTPDDLGTQSEPPSHPELFDYLSSYLMDRNWSLKDLHRLIMNSRVYQITSDTRKEYEQIDPENRLLWRANIRRLDFEAMRDSLLVFSGKLDRSVGGQPVNLTDEPYSYRRSVYGYIDRGNLPELMAHFDFSQPDMPNSRRTSTIVPQQALYLMNSPMAVDVARSVVARREIAGTTNALARVIEIYRVLFQRQPSQAEIKLAYQFVNYDERNTPQITDAQKKINEELQKKSEASSSGDMMAGSDNGMAAIRNEGAYVMRKPLTPWETYVHALLLSNEAAYVN
jgi:mono/diheme cytochrome c family protein